MGGVVVFSPPMRQAGVRSLAVASQPVTRLRLVQLRLQMHTSWFVKFHWWQWRFMIIGDNGANQKIIMLVVAHLQWQQWWQWRKWRQWCHCRHCHKWIAMGSIVAIGTTGAIGITNDPFTLSGDCKKSIHWCFHWFHYYGSDGRQWRSPLASMKHNHWRLWRFEPSLAPLTSSPLTPMEHSLAPIAPLTKLYDPLTSFWKTYIGDSLYRKISKLLDYFDTYRSNLDAGGCENKTYRKTSMG